MRKGNSELAKRADALSHTICQVFAGQSGGGNVTVDRTHQEDAFATPLQNFKKRAEMNVWRTQLAVQHRSVWYGGAVF